MLVEEKYDTRNVTMTLLDFPIVLYYLQVLSIVLVANLNGLVLRYHDYTIHLNLKLQFKLICAAIRDKKNDKK